MESATQSTREIDALNRNQSEEDARHRPFRSWALQQNLIALLGNEPNWEQGANATDTESEHDDGSRRMHGQGYLRNELQNNPEFELRTKTSIALWASALITDSLNQYGPTGLAMASHHFTITIIGVILALIVTAIVYPQLSPQSFPIVEQFMLTLAFALITFQCSVTGGLDSPYSVWLIFTVFYAAYFMPSKQVVFNTVLAAGIAVAPMVYEPSETTSNAALFAVLLAAIACTLAYTVFSRRQLGRGAERGVKFLALADPLTSVANLRAFENLSDHLTANAPGTFAIAMVDMNGLKGANTVFGYDVGDDMVVRLSRLMLQVSGANDQVARIGGDEFAVVIPGGNARDVDNWRVRFDEAVNSHNERIRGRLPQISVAMGTATFPQDGRTTDEMIEAADQRMYAQKDHAVTPPYVINEASPVDATRLLGSPHALGTPKRAFSDRELGVQAGVSWLVTGLAVISWPLIPGADVPYPAAVLGLGVYCFLIATMAYIGQQARFKPLGWKIADFATLTIAAPALWITGGWESPFQLTGMLVVAYYAQFYRGHIAVARIAAVMGGYSVAFWTSGTVSPAGQSLFATIITAEIVVAVLLQVNAKAIDQSLAVIRDSATHDALTGLENLHAFRDDLSKATAVAVADDETDQMRTALVLADLDSFRDVNTQAGHRGGDSILREAARRLETANNKDGTIYRVGGDEFAILFKVERFGDAAAFAERCRRALTFVPPDHLKIEGQVSASVGFAVLREEMSREKFVGAVEAALAESKTSQGDSVTGDTNVML